MADKSAKKQNVLGGAMVLVVATALVKIIGAVYKIPLTGIIGSLGRGYFASAYNIYTPIYAISMAGLPVAVSTIVSKNVALGKYRDVKQVMKITFPLFLALGIVGTGALLLAARPYVDSVGSPYAIFSVYAIAPSILFCCMMSTYRGYYEGLNNMYPTAISQVIESIGKLVFGLVLSYGVINYATAEVAANGQVFGQMAEGDALPAIVYAVAAAAAILGVTLGTVFGTIYTVLRHKIKKDGISKDMLVNSPLATRNKDTVSEIIKIAVPTAVSSLVLNITNFIDTWMIQNRLKSVVAESFSVIMGIYGDSIEQASISSDAIHTFLYGAYDTTLDFRNLIPTIMMTLGVSAIPIISGARAKNDGKTINETVNTVFRTTMLIALPAGAGFFALSEPILSLLYTGTENQSGIAVAAPVLALYGLMMPILTLSSPLTNILQAIGRADVPAKALAIGCAFKIGLNFFLIGIPSVNIKGAVFGTAFFYLLCIFINYFVLRKETGVRIDIKTVLVKPFIAAVLCGVSAWGSYTLLCSVLTFGDMSSRLNGHSLACLISIGVAVLVYAISALLLKTLVKNDILLLPKGEKIAEILEKYKLIV
ncbi:MAG: polysaccharide biosynthesis protein [Clostridia bacterium]|nr:polysaccharide biosynthesis protein [Clostridia bacterium]